MATASLASLLFSCWDKNIAGIEVGNPNEKTVLGMTIEIDSATQIIAARKQIALGKRAAFEPVSITQFELNFHQIEYVVSSKVANIEIVNYPYPGKFFNMLEGSILRDTLSFNLKTKTDSFSLQYEFYYPDDNIITSFDFDLPAPRGVLKGKKGHYPFLFAFPDMTAYPALGLGSPELRFAYPKNKLEASDLSNLYKLKLIFYSGYWLSPFDFSTAEPDTTPKGDTIYVFSKHRNSAMHSLMKDRFINSFSEPFDTNVQ